MEIFTVLLITVLLIPVLYVFVCRLIDEFLLMAVIFADIFIMFCFRLTLVSMIANIQSVIEVRNSCLVFHVYVNQLWIYCT